MKIQITGLGYIGLPTAVLIANNDIKVYGVDTNTTVVDKINLGEVHIVEPGLGELLLKSVKKGNLSASTKPNEADVHIIVVPTPFKENLVPDISYVEKAILSILPVLKKDNLLIIESTCPVGTTEKMANYIFNEKPELLNNIYVAYCPERVLPGNVFYELVNNDRVIGGINIESTNKAIEFYNYFVKGQKHPTNSRTAELCKLTENSSRDVQIAFANELSMICDKAEINVWDLISLANKHPRVNILQPGSGVGGHCIAVDPYFIAHDYPKESILISKAREINNYKSEWCVEKIINTVLEFNLKNKFEPTIALMGMAFKPNIDDLRESPAVYIINQVHNRLKNNTIISEPNIQTHKIYKLTDFKEAYENSDIVVFLVSHDEYKSLVINEGKIILDFCGIFKLK
ncbi:MAG: UDP-N-acetyl-D-mannosamine dehydrogenase [bacterium]